MAAQALVGSLQIGVLLPLTMLVALATDLLLLPALITVGVVRFRSRA